PTSSAGRARKRRRRPRRARERSEHCRTAERFARRSRRGARPQDGGPVSKRVAGKIALVTGAASGIGRACAQHLAREGAVVVLTGGGVAGGEAAAAALGAPHGFRALDVTDPAAWASAVDATVSALGRLDVLVNAAGVGVMHDIERTTLEEWRFVHAVNS